MKTLIFCIGILICAIGCTEQERAKYYGGTSAIEVPECEKVVNLTWKGADLWILTRPMGGDERPERLTFSESSAWGILKGTIIVNEKCGKL